MTLIEVTNILDCQVKIQQLNKMQAGVNNINKVKYTDSLFLI